MLQYMWATSFIGSFTLSLRIYCGLQHGSPFKMKIIIYWKRKIIGKMLISDFTEFLLSSWWTRMVSEPSSPCSQTNINQAEVLLY